MSVATTALQERIDIEQADFNRVGGDLLLATVQLNRVWAVKDAMEAVKAAEDEALWGKERDVPAGALEERPDIVESTMASILENCTDHARETEPAAVIDAAEFEEAQRDPRVRDFLAEADSYLAERERLRRASKGCDDES